MERLYLLFFFFVCFLGHSQDARANNGDIEGFRLYPNPVVQGRVHIETSQNAPKKVQIFDVLGTKVLQTTVFGTELHVSDLDSGVYILRVFQQNKVATRKLIIK